MIERVSNHEPSAERMEEVEVPLSDSLVLQLKPGRVGYIVSICEKKGAGKNDVVLNDIAPSIIFRQTSLHLPSMGATLSTREVAIDIKEIVNDPKRIMAVLHEMGHIVEVDALPAPARPLYRRLQEIAPYDWSQRFGRFNSYTIQAERNAWVEAFRIFRIVRERGVDIGSLFGSSAEMAKFCMQHHSVYEIEKSSIKIDSFLLRLCEPFFISRSLREKNKANQVQEP